MYYVCGRWFIGLEIGVCGGWVFTKTMDICAHGNHEDTWYFITGAGLQQDKSFRVKEACDQPAEPPRPQEQQPQLFTGNIAQKFRLVGLGRSYRKHDNITYNMNFMILHLLLDRSMTTLTELRSGKGRERESVTPSTLMLSTDNLWSVTPHNLRYQYLSTY